MTHLHIPVPAITRGTLARTHELKKDNRDSDDRRSGCGILVKKVREGGIRNPLSRSSSNRTALSRDGWQRIKC